MVSGDQYQKSNKPGTIKLRVAAPFYYYLFATVMCTYVNGRENKSNWSKINCLFRSQNNIGMNIMFNQIHKGLMIERI